MLAYHNDPKLKRAMLAEVRKHIAMTSATLVGSSTMVSPWPAR